MRNLLGRALVSAGLVAVFGSAMGLSSQAFASNHDRDRIELGLDRVMAPRVGYDDNDQVQVIARGYLPNQCYQLAESFVQQLDDGKSIRIAQYALRTHDGPCAEGMNLPPHLAMEVPFTTEILVGRLPAADYNIVFKNETGGEQVRALNVAVATSSQIDSLPYAAVSNAAIPEIVSSRDEVTTVLSGVLNSTCTELSEVKVLRQEDVIVLLPTIRVKPGVVCAQMLIPFELPVKLGKLPVGKYLVHARSMNGRAVNRFVESGRGL